MGDAIWERVYRCAEELTRRGVTPFSRGDLIRCVQRCDPACNPDSINPVIQGLTDNLRGGAPGAVGKNLLHSVGRGLFILRDTAFKSFPKEPATASLRSEFSPPQEERTSLAKVACNALLIGEYTFDFICDIKPELKEDGTPREFFPHLRYKNTKGLALNKYGTGPFCKFKIPSNIKKSGVYAIVVNSLIKYIGECKSLSDRFNMGYGIISPRKCYIGGQETNCRINALILKSLGEGLKVALWFHETDDYKRIESDHRAQEKLEWNRA